MPTLTNHPAPSRVKAMIVGDPGSGKTLSLSHLVKAGFKLGIIDFDNGLDTLARNLTKKEAENVSYISVPWNKLGSFAACKKAISDWDDNESKLGPVNKWGTERILVIDSFTYCCIAALRHALVMNGKTPDATSFDQVIWGVGIKEIEALLMDLMSDSYGCHIVLTSHFRALDDATGATRLYPSAVTKNQSLIINRFFNDVWRIDVKTDGKRVFRTQSDFRMTLRCSNFTAVKAEEDFDLGLLIKKVLSPK